MPGYLLDTCAWIDSLLAPEKLRQPIRRLIGSAPHTSPLFGQSHRVREKGSAW